MLPRQRDEAREDGEWEMARQRSRAFCRCIEHDPGKPSRGAARNESAEIGGAVGEDHRDETDSTAS